ncbi:hypothetical protein HNQ75_004543 [Rhizobium flavum]|uniref:Uncharacterized protein n=1 Tax=Pseudorhizobium flavum TaxID=1335061 RepID=A0A7X0DGV0_9HYPH|nr:hypothetical protein [Pseudorhizobium flavum]CAD6599411.1 hypothetical protein RFYW14_00671 [Pseudorhizobium flavum]
MFCFCGLKFVAVPLYVVPVHDQCIQSGLRRCWNTDEDLTLNLLGKAFGLP